MSLADRQMKVKRPRLRHRQEGELIAPAYESPQENSATAQRIMGALLRGLSHANTQKCCPRWRNPRRVAHRISRPAIEGSVEQLRQVRERR